MLADRVRMATFKDSLFIPEGYVLATMMILVVHQMAVSDI